MVKNESVKQKKHLSLHGFDLIELCTKYGSPLFVFDEDCIVNNFHRFRVAFEKNFSKSIVCYSIKTNNNINICKLLQKEGAYAEVGSGLDLYIAHEAGFPGDRIIFDGPYKSESDIKFALEKEILLINVESYSEIKRLDKIAEKLGKIPKIGIRINPFKPKPIYAKINVKNLIDSINSHAHSRFGLSLNEAYNVFKNSYKYTNLIIEGIMVHPYYKALDVILPLMKKVHKNLGIEIKYINVGGGFNPGTTISINYYDLFLDLIKQKIGLKSTLDNKEKNSHNIEVISSLMAEKVKKSGINFEPIIVTEPGSYIIGPAGILLLNIDHIKNSYGYKWLFVNGGTNIIPSTNIFTRRNIIIANKVSDKKEEVVNVVGPMLYSDDVLALKTLLPKAEEGDILAIFDCGAYSLTSSTQFLYPRPAAIMLNSRKRLKVIRNREVYEDIIYKDNL